MKFTIVKPRRNPIARDLRTPKYRMRVVKSKKLYDRNSFKQTHSYNDESSNS